MQLNPTIIATLASNRYLQATALIVSVMAGVLTVYHMVNYHIPLAKLQLEEAKNKAAAGKP
mgnify:CR=1 FL=1